MPAGTDNLTDQAQGTQLGATMKRSIIRLLLGLLIQTGFAFCQPVPTAQTAGAQAGQQQAAQPTETTGQSQQLRLNYVIHSGDQILIRAFEVDEISERPFRVDGDGFINIPLLGRVKAGGLTVEHLEAALVELLKKYVRKPQVTVTMVQLSSEPVFFVGAFKAPGIYPLAGRRTLVEMIASIGGFQATASRRIKITRRKEYGVIPLPNAVPAPDGSGTSIEINAASLRENVNPAEDILLEPFDVISVEQAEKVYITGEVGHTGAYDLLERDSISILQALTLAGGVKDSANKKRAIILRPVLNTSRRAEIPINLTRILKGEDSDRPLLPNDVLYVQKGSVLSTSLGKILLIAIPLAATLAITIVR